MIVQSLLVLCAQPTIGLPEALVAGEDTINDRWAGSWTTWILFRNKNLVKHGPGIRIALHLLNGSRTVRRTGPVVRESRRSKHQLPSSNARQIFIEIVGPGHDLIDGRHGRVLSNSAVVAVPIVARVIPQVPPRVVGDVPRDIEPSKNVHFRQQ